MSACKVSGSPLVRTTNVRGYRQTSAIALLRVEERRSCHKEETAATPCLGLVHTGKEEGTRNCIWRRATRISAKTLLKVPKAAIEGLFAATSKESFKGDECHEGHEADEGNDDEQVRCDETDEKAQSKGQLSKSLHLTC